jgi:hypothetical protein
LTPLRYPTIYDRVRLLELIESAIDADPTCPSCGATTEVVDEDGALVLRCSAISTINGVLGRLRAAVLPHFHHVLLEADELIAA